MKDRVDKSIGIVTRIAESLAKINPTEPLKVIQGKGKFFFHPNKKGESRGKKMSL